jgi:hypothetical protein
MSNGHRLDRSLPVGSPIEFTFPIPLELTLVGTLLVRCKGSVVRVAAVEPDTVLITAVIQQYEFLES